MSVITCRHCGCPTIDPETDECMICGRRDRKIESPAGWLVIFIVIQAVALAVLGWRVL